MKGGATSVQAFQPTYTQERVQGAPIVNQETRMLDGAPVIVGQTPKETVVAGQVSQNIVEIPTVSEQVNEVIVPEITNVETIVEVPQVVQRTGEQIVHRLYNLLVGLFAIQEHGKHSEKIGLSLVVDMSNYVETADMLYTHDLCVENKDDRVCEASIMLMKSSEFRTRFAVDQLGFISLKNREDPLWRIADENSKERATGRGLMAALRAASARRCRQPRSRRIRNDHADEPDGPTLEGRGCERGARGLAPGQRHLLRVRGGSR